MSLLDEIVVAPNECLTQRCAPIEKIDAHIKRLAKRMLKIMYAANGVGLAAPQIGEMLQLVVIDVNYVNGKKDPFVLINPEIISVSDTMMPFHEGCLSFPGITVATERPDHVIVHAENLDGELMEYEASNNLFCVCLQHEIDHLFGTTMLDKLAPQDRLKALQSYEQAKQAGVKPGDTEYIS